MNAKLAIPAMIGGAFWLSEKRKTKRGGKFLLGAGLGLLAVMYGPRIGLRLGA